MATTQNTSANADCKIHIEYRDGCPFLNGLPILPTRPVPRQVCWVLLGWGDHCEYFLFDPEQPGSLREIQGQ